MRPPSGAQPAQEPDSRDEPTEPNCGEENQYRRGKGEPQLSVARHKGERTFQTVQDHLVAQIRKIRGAAVRSDLLYPFAITRSNEEHEPGGPCDVGHKTHAT